MSADLQLAGILSAILLTPAAWSQPAYHLEQLPDTTQAVAINNHGSIAGYALTPDYRAVLMADTTRVLSGKAGESVASGVNESDVVTYNVSGGGVHCGVWLPSGPYRDLGTLGGTECSSADLNNAGLIVGSSTLANGKTHAFLFDGAMHDLGSLGGDSQASGINDRGQVAGTSDLGNGMTHAFLLRDTMMDLGDLGGGYSSGAAINASGHVAGVSNPQAKGPNHAFLWDGVMHDLGALGTNRLADSGAYAVNRADEVVGYSRYNSPQDQAPHAFLYTGGVMYDLLSLIDASRQGWSSLSFANDINDSGDIVGLGLYQGQQRAFVARRVTPGVAK